MKWGLRPGERLEEFISEWEKDQGRQMGRVPSSLQGGARALQVERTGQAGTCLECAKVRDSWGMAEARYVAGCGVTGCKGHGARWVRVGDRGGFGGQPRFCRGPSELGQGRRRGWESQLSTSSSEDRAESGLV